MGCFAKRHKEGARRAGDSRVAEQHGDPVLVHAVARKSVGEKHRSTCTLREKTTDCQRRICAISYKICSSYSPVYHPQPLRCNPVKAENSQCLNPTIIV